MGIIRIYDIVIKIYYMKERTKKQNDPYLLNKRLDNAYQWLRANKYIKNAAQLALLWGVSKSTASEYLTSKRKLGHASAARFESKLLHKHNLTLDQFRTDVLVKQAKTVMPSKSDIVSLFATQLLRLEAGQEIMLDKLTVMEEKIGELRALVTKFVKASS